jgi:diaminohydroxyphosphoribosylaminopyrimidine deaminase/5-amino-6-(5-phosphoribosylamino)uracil reductase
MAISAADERYMRLALELADRGRYTAAPNPVVGCVIVDASGTIIGQGWHSACGAPHAEAEAFESMAAADIEQLHESTWYVTLEPCNHVGRTPACAALIEQVKPRRVVIGCLDPNPQVTGGGMKRIEDAGIEVEHGCLATELEWQNRRFFWNASTGLPWVVLKWAESANGFMDGRPSHDRTPGAGGFAITGPEAKKVTHQWRAMEQAIAVGANTALIDQPQLTVREIDAPSPRVVLLDPDGLVGADHPMVRLYPPVVHAVSPDANQIIGQHCPWSLDEGLEVLLSRLCTDFGISSLLIEGGAAVLSAFLNEGQWNEIKRWQSPQHLDGGLKAPSMPTKLSLPPSDAAHDGVVGLDRWVHRLHPRHRFA